MCSRTNTTGDVSSIGIHSYKGEGMNIRERIEDLEQQIYIAYSDGDYERMNMLENQLEQLRGRMAHVLDDDPYALEDYMWDDE
jgi:hypothetical protein